MPGLSVTGPATSEGVASWPVPCRTFPTPPDRLGGRFRAANGRFYPWWFRVLTRCTRPFWLCPFALDPLGRMKVHQDNTPRIVHGITHLDDASWAFAPSFRTTATKHHSNRTDGVALDHPLRLLGSSRPPTPNACKTGAGCHARLPCGYRSAT